MRDGVKIVLNKMDSTANESLQSQPSMSAAAAQERPKKKNEMVLYTPEQLDATKMYCANVRDDITDTMKAVEKMQGRALKNKGSLEQVEEK